MAQHSRFTPATDAEINRLRYAGLTWADIALTVFGVKYGGNGVKARAVRVGLPCLAMEPPQPVVAAPSMSERKMAGKEPLPAFHPIAAAVLGVGA